MNWIPFVQTGNVAVDGLMSQVSDVAKMWRRTEDWCQGDEPHSGLNILSQAAQDAANQIADNEKQSLKHLESVVSIDAVEGFLKTLEFSPGCDDIAITLVHGNIRNFAWIVRNELARIMGKETHDDA